MLRNNEFDAKMATEYLMTITDLENEIRRLRLYIDRLENSYGCGERNLEYVKGLNTVFRRRIRELEQENNRLNKYIQQLFRVMLKEVKEKV